MSDGDEEVTLDARKEDADELGRILRHLVKIDRSAPGFAWFRVVVSAPPELLPLIAGAVGTAVPLTWIFTRIALHNGMLIAAGRTHWVTAGMAGRILGYLVIGISLPAVTSMFGAMVAATTLVAAGTHQLAVLVAGSRRAGPRYPDPVRSSGD